jgi:hypothetical protein
VTLDPVALSVPFWDFVAPTAMLPKSMLPGTGVSWDAASVLVLFEPAPQPESRDVASRRIEMYLRRMAIRISVYCAHPRKQLTEFQEAWPNSGGLGALVIQSIMGLARHGTSPPSEDTSAKLERT